MTTACMSLEVRTVVASVLLLFFVGVVGIIDVVIVAVVVVAVVVFVVVLHTSLIVLMVGYRLQWRQLSQ